MPRFSDQERTVLDVIYRQCGASRPPTIEDIARLSGIRDVDPIVKKLYSNRVIDIARPRKARSPRRWAPVEAQPGE